MSKFYAKGQYSTSYLETLTKAEWLSLKPSTRSDIRLALSQSIPYCRGPEKERLMLIRSKLIEFSL